jgi:hypothetical protein
LGMEEQAASSKGMAVRRKKVPFRMVSGLIISCHRA